MEMIFDRRNDKMYFVNEEPHDDSLKEIVFKRDTGDDNKGTAAMPGKTQFQGSVLKIINSLNLSFNNTD